MDKSATWGKLLNTGEKIEFEFSIGDTYLKRSLICSLIILVPMALMFHGPISIGILLLVIFLYGFYFKAANTYAFTNRRVLIHRGWLSTNTISIDYAKITDISVKESFGQKTFYKTGEIRINTAGSSSTEAVLKNVERPYEIKKRLAELMDKTK